MHRSQIYRGTPEAPGLVLGLERGGECEGVGYRVAAELHQETMAYLRERELITDVYDETLLTIETRDGARRQAYAYVANTEHEEYVAMDFDRAVERIATARGEAGPNYEYALNTWVNLAGLGIHDSLVERVANALRARERRRPERPPSGGPGRQVFDQPPPLALALGQNVDLEFDVLKPPGVAPPKLRQPRLGKRAEVEAGEQRAARLPRRNDQHRVLVGRAIGRRIGAEHIGAPGSAAPMAELVAQHGLAGVVARRVLVEAARPTRIRA